MSACSKPRPWRSLLLALMLGAAATGAQAQTVAADAELDAMFRQASQSRAMLRVLLQKMPKGADLHNHAGGNIYAEDFIAWAAENDGCYVFERKALVAPPCNDFESIPAKQLMGNAMLYSDVVDAISTRRFDLGVGDPTVSGHRRFFQSFGRAGGGRGVPGRTLAVSVEYAAQDNLMYLELMQGPGGGRPIVEASAAMPWDEADMEGRLARLQPLIAAALPLAVEQTALNLKAAGEINGCGTDKPKPGCKVTVRFLQSLSRENQPGALFGQMAYAFAVARADPRYVGINIVQPEDGAISTRDYRLHMRMFAFFKAKYPEVKLTLHAGELALGLTEPRDLRFHITEAVEIAGAKRIGHGVSIAFEDDAEALLAKMAREKIAVEINLTSNDVILGVKGADHPLPLYLAAGVPVALSTDDMGVSRHDLSQEYVRAVAEHGLSYTQLRKITRDSLTYSFLEGESLWDASGARLGAACPKIVAAPTGACDALLKASAKAREQHRLELALAAYEQELRQTFAAIPPSDLTREP